MTNRMAATMTAIVRLRYKTGDDSHRKETLRHHTSRPLVLDDPENILLISITELVGYVFDRYAYVRPQPCPIDLSELSLMPALKRVFIRHQRLAVTNAHKLFENAPVLERFDIEVMGRFIWTTPDMVISAKSTLAIRGEGMVADLSAFPDASCIRVTKAIDYAILPEHLRHLMGWAIVALCEGKHYVYRREKEDITENLTPTALEYIQGKRVKSARSAFFRAADLSDVSRSEKKLEVVVLVDGELQSGPGSGGGRSCGWSIMRIGAEYGSEAILSVGANTANQGVGICF